MNLQTELACKIDPAQLMIEAGLAPDPWQDRALRTESKRVLILAPRQSGKSTTTSLIALHPALFRPGSLILVTSRTERQSLELFRKIIDSYHRLGDPVPAVRELTFSLELANQSRVVALPGDPANLRGFSGPWLVLVDEAALVDDALFTAVLPMLATSQGRLVALSTPFGRRGFYCSQWENADPTWERITARATECPRIDPEFLAEQRRLLGPRMFAQEFDCQFVEAVDQVFSTESIEAIFQGADSELPALTGI
jgi:Terminase large subunit, T4likevirus-type, N-terminal